MIVDGQRINACLDLAVMHQGDAIARSKTGTPDRMHPMQAAFVKHDGYQCGYCARPDLLGGGVIDGGSTSPAMRPATSPGVAMSADGYASG